MPTLGEATSWIRVLPDLTNFAREARAKLVPAMKQLDADIPVGADVTKADAALKKLKASIRERADILIGADDKLVRAKALELKAAFAKLELKPNINPDLNLAKLLRIDAALDKAAKDRTAHIKVKTDSLGSKAAAGLGGAPAWLGAGLLLAPGAVTLAGAAAGAIAGIGGAAVAAGGALLGFGSVAKPVLSDALKAEQAVEAAQILYNAKIKAGVKQSSAYRTEQVAINKAYGEMSKQQIALSKQLGNMASRWQDVKAALTPIVSSAIQPWLAAVTDGVKFLVPIVNAVSPVIKGLGQQFDGLVNSTGFTKFVSFIAGTGSQAVGAIGGSLINFLDGMIILLPKFNPLIQKAIGWIANLGPSFLQWASSQKTADKITAFMAWFVKNGPAAGKFLSNLGGAIKALAPGFAAGGALELKVISDFLGFVAKLPPKLAAPLAEVAGAALILAKLPGGQKTISFLVSGALGGIFSAGKGGSAASATALTPIMAKIFGAGVTVAAGVLVAELVVKPLLQGTSSGTVKGTNKPANWWDNPFGANPKGTPAQQGLSTWAGLGHAIAHNWDVAWNSVVGRTTRGLDSVDRLLSNNHVGHIFDITRHAVASIWDLTWHNTIDRLNNGVNDTGRYLGIWRHNVSSAFDTARHTVASIWDSAWNGLKRATATGISDVVRFFSGLPGKVLNALVGFGADLWGVGKQVINDFWTGVKAIWDGAKGVVSWFTGLPSKILHALGIKSPPSWAIDAGRHVMGGLLRGIAHGAADVKAFFVGLASDITGPLKAVWSTISGSFTHAGTSADVIGWLTAAMKDTGEPSSWLPPLELLVGKESGGNPAAVNPIAIMGEHAEGLMQMLPSTYAQFATIPGGIFDPVSNAAAALRYIAARYGSPWNIPGLFGGVYRGYAAGTASAAPGYAWVGETGPELLRFRGGEQVIPWNSRGSSSTAARGGDTYYVENHLHVHGPVGSQAQLQQWLGSSIDQLARQGRLIYAFRHSPSGIVR